jgi:hypothetical protein
MIFNNLEDGTIEVFIDTNGGVGTPNYVPTPVGAFCCAFINEANSGNSTYQPHPNTTGHTYTWDADRQECRWLKYADCDNLPLINVVLNPQGNSGAIFQVTNGETCVLNVEFDYMFKFNCQDILDVQINSVEPVLTGLYNQLDNAMNDCTATQEALDNIQGGWNYVIPYNDNGNTFYLCITEAGLPLLEATINNYHGPTGWSSYLTGTSPISSPWALNPLVGVEMFLANAENQVLYLTDCTANGLELISDSYAWLSQYTTLTDALTTCTALIEYLNTQINNILAQEANNCIYAIDTFEELIINMAIDLQDPNQPNIVDTVYTEEIFNVGQGNLVNYLFNNPLNPIYVENYNWITCDSTACNGLANILSQQMIDQANEADLLTGTTFVSQYNQLINLVGQDALAPAWFHYSGTISDPAIISGITNGYVNLSLQIVDSCVNFSILLDRIELNKDCTRVTNTEIFVNSNPSFDIVKKCDNKKSWVYNESPEERDYNLSMRNTDYDVNDSRLVLNTKEVDLNISIDNGIETDVWCYINDNPCILEPCYDSSYTGLTGTTCCCDDIPLSGTNITGGTVALPPASAVTPCERVVGGEGPAGGIVYWVNPADPCEGYEVMPYDQAVADAWDTTAPPNTYIGGTSQAFGTGAANTALIIAASLPTTAAITCNNLVYGGFSDWYLPSAQDLVSIYNNLNTLTGSTYWSSSEAGSAAVSGNAYQMSNTGVISSVKKMFTRYVRAVRYFNTNPCNAIYSALTASTVINGIDEELTDCSWIYKFNTSLSASTTFDGYWLAGMPDGTVGVFQQITTSGGTGYTIDYSDVISKGCCESFNQSIQDYAWSSNKGQYYVEFGWSDDCEQCKFVRCEKPQCVDFTELLTTTVTGITTVEAFNEVISSELINVKCRKTSSSYPTLRALYDRYMNSTEYCGTQSSAFDYFSMSDFGNLVGTYWVDLFEQVIPSTTIWCANHIHGNTLYDQQKFQYKGYSMYPCNTQFHTNAPVIAPFHWTASGAADVDVYRITQDSVCETMTQCSGVYFVSGDCGSEFLGTVSTSSTNLLPGGGIGGIILGN